MGSKGKLKGVRICNNCGGLILIYHKDRLNRSNIFCSKKCEGEYRRKIANYKHNNNRIICDQCGKPFYKKPSSINDTHNFCSQECHYKFKEKSMLGEGNHQYGLKGRLNDSWKSDNRITSNGYLRIYKPEHPLSDRDGRILEHRYIAENFLATKEELVLYEGTYVLNPNLDVHHKDKNKLNNDINNLQILTRSEHAKIHQDYKRRKGMKINKCKQCGEDFITTKSRDSKYCSIECYEASRKSKQIEKICPCCNTKFIVSKEQYNKRTCCSVECSNKLRNRGRVDFTCDNCGKNSSMKKSGYNRSEKHFCCKECYYEYRRKVNKK